MSLFKNLNIDKLKDGLSKTRNKLFNGINEVLTGKAVVDDKTLDEIEEILITSDIGAETAERIIESARVALKSEKDRSSVGIIESIKKELNLILTNTVNPISAEEKFNSFKPYVILIIGVNGAGKTTTIGKLANNFKKSGLKVIVGAADTFRAAAKEQVVIWAQRAGVEIIQGSQGSDPSSVAFETIASAINGKFDVVLIDTAGRLHTKAGLMDELAKIKRVIKKQLEYAPNETYLVIDGNTGQNAVAQVNEFSKITKLDGLIVTKLDGTAKGGVIFQICSQHRVPVKYIGVGEGIDDLQDFAPDLFISAIFNNN